ncbi:hypothetical protein ACFOHO_10865 [Rhizorhabdus histidinilytica]|uniref:hypothetical protein n=1 Tax=Rhizorhabdus histidinilytica TaxID=439228 RepID=UPI00360892A9
MSEDQPRPKTVFSIEEPPIELMIQRIDERLKVLGLTDRQASIRATGLPDAIREIRRFKRPGSKRMIQLAKALETTPDWLGGYVDHQRGKVWLESTESALPIYGVADLPRDIPVFAASVDETAPAFFKDIVEKEHSIEVKKRLYVMCFGYNFNDPIDFARRPPQASEARRLLRDHYP